jgi:hypothetical protein
MTTPTLRAIKCSERMPTSEDANVWDEVLWFDGRAHIVASNYQVVPMWATHFFPLNRSAIATDAEEQT